MDLLDFYRGTLSIRRLIVLLRHLSAESATSRAINDGHPPWTTTDHLLADLWVLSTQQDHPRRAEMEAKERTNAKVARLAEMRARNEKRKRANGLG